MKVIGFIAAIAAVAAQPSKMQRVHTTGLLGCKSPYKCVELESADTPKPKSGEALIQIDSTSVNPSDLDLLQLGKGCLHSFRCLTPTCRAHTTQALAATAAAMTARAPWFPAQAARASR